MLATARELTPTKPRRSVVATHERPGPFESAHWRRDDGHCFVFFWTVDGVDAFYRHLELMAIRYENGDSDLEFTWPDFFKILKGTRRRLRELSEART